MHDIPLNDTQRIFAEKNHNLVYKFLHEKNLPASEYYDIVMYAVKSISNCTCSGLNSLSDRTLHFSPLVK